MTSNLAFDLRLVQYTPLSVRIGPIPDLGFTITSTPAGPVLSAKVSTVVAGSLPKELELVVEWWHQSTNTWQEGRDSRFFVTQQASDDRDATGVVTLTGIGIAAFLMQKAALAGVEPYQNFGVRSEAAATNTSVSVSGTTFTWPSHVFGEGDLVRVHAKGDAKNLSGGSTYYVRNPTTNTFQISASPHGTIKNCGSASNVSMERVVTRIVFTGGSHQFTKSMAVALTGATPVGLANDSAYYVVNPTTATIQVSDKPGGKPLEMSAANTTFGSVYRFLDGQRVFTNAHPGVVIGNAFLEARARGWGFNGITGDTSNTLFHGWTNAADSAGNAWATMADDPDTPGISVGFQPGTPLSQMLSFMLENQYAEWYTTGRTIQLVNYGTGVDYSITNVPFRIGTTASSVPVTVDYTDVMNSAIVRGTGPVLQEYDASSLGNWGRLEEYFTASGATTKSTALKQGKTNVAANATGQIGYQVIEAAQEAAFLPLKDYQRGDWIAVQLAGTGWTRLRVTQWQFDKATDGSVKTTATLQYVKPTALKKALAATKGSSAGISDGGSSTSPILASDNRKASAPTGVAVTMLGEFAADDSANCLVTVSWNPVTADIDGNDITTAVYEVFVRAEGALNNGVIQGTTGALSMTLDPLPAGHTYAVSVRAQSDTGQWGELSDETEFTTVYPTAVPNPPTSPTVTGHLGQARVAWDGNLVDPTLGNIAPDAGFARVEVWYSTTSGGTYTPIGSAMGNAGSIAVSSLSIGSMYWFALFAVNTVGVYSAMSSPVSYTIVGVSGPDLIANSVTANSVAAGAITADKLDIGTVPSGSPLDRVPMPVTNAAYWALITGGSMNLQTGYTQYQLATPTSTGIQLAPTSGGGAWCFLFGPTPDVASGQLHLSGLSTGANSVFQVYEYPNATGTTGVTITSVPITPAGTLFTLQSTTVRYAVQIYNAAAHATETVEAAHIFEVIGTTGGGQAVEISPAGLVMFDNNGNPAINLTTSSQQYFAMYDSSTADPNVVASIDSSGNASFTEVSSDNGFDISGVLLTDITDPDSIANATPNGSSWDPSIVPILDRFPRGPIYDVTWPSQNGVVVSTQYRRIAQDVFTLEPGRYYLLLVELAGLQVTNGSGVNVYVELQLNLTPNTSPTSGTIVSRAVVYNGDSGYYALMPVLWSASATQATIDATNRKLPSGVPIYWQLNTNLSSAPTANYTFAEFGQSRGFSVIDMGNAYIVRPAGPYTDALVDVHDYTTSGSSSGSSSSGTTSSPTTMTFTANSSRTWHNSGSTIVTGSGQYDNGAAMYYGTGVTPMGSWFGQFKNAAGTLLGTVLAGKTITSAVLTVQNTYTAYSNGATVSFGTASTASAPSSIGSPANNVFSATFAKGAKKSMTLSSAIRSGLSGGSVNSFVLGVSSSSTNYSYFNGTSQSSPPTLKVTFH